MWKEAGGTEKKSLRDREEMDMACKVEEVGDAELARLKSYFSRPQQKFIGKRFMNQEEAYLFRRQLQKSQGFEATVPEGTTLQDVRVIAPEDLSKNLEPFKKYLDFAIKELRQIVGYPAELVEAMRLNVFYSGTCRYFFTFKTSEGKLEKVYRALVQVPAGTLDMELSYLEERSPNPTIWLTEPSGNESMDVESGAESGKPVGKDEPQERKGFEFTNPLFSHQDLIEMVEALKKYLDFAVYELEQIVGKPIQLLEVMKVNENYTIFGGFYYFILKMSDGKLEKVYWALVKQPVDTDRMYLSYLEERTPNPIILLSDSIQKKFSDGEEKAKVEVGGGAELTQSLVKKGGGSSMLSQLKRSMEKMVNSPVVKKKDREEKDTAYKGGKGVGLSLLKKATTEEMKSATKKMRRDGEEMDMEEIGGVKLSHLKRHSSCLPPKFHGKRLMNEKEARLFRRQLEETRGFEATVPEGTTLRGALLLTREDMSEKLDTFKKYLDFAIKEIQQKVGYPVELAEVTRLYVFHSNFRRYHFTLKMSEGNLEKVYWALVKVPVGTQDMELSYLEERSPNPAILFPALSRNAVEAIKKGEEERASLV